MNYKLIGAAIMGLAVIATGAVAAAPGGAPVDVPTDRQSDQSDNASSPEWRDGQYSEPRVESNDQQGPPVDLPSRVPDFVNDVHEVIRQHVDGSLDSSLGDKVKSLTPNEPNLAANATVMDFNGV